MNSNNSDYDPLPALLKRLIEFSALLHRDQYVLYVVNEQICL